MSLRRNVYPSNGEGSRGSRVIPLSHLVFAHGHDHE